MSFVFITGSGRRIGRGLAIEFAKKNWNVAIHYNSSRDKAEQTFEEVKSYGVESILVHGDVRNKPEMDNAISKAVEKLGIPDLLINNAAVFPEQREFERIDDELWDFVLESNLRSQLYVSQIYYDLIKKNNRKGRIINFVSLGAFQIWKNRAVYHVSKAGANQLTKAMAKDLAPMVSVNSISPGIIIMPGEEQETSGFPEEKIPMKRYGNVKDVFDVAYFFATCSDYITGQNINIDGGQSL